jgi:putative restriction endonuclease
LEPALQGLFREFGFGAGKFRAEYPFYYLTSDGLWTLESPLNKEPTAKFLRDSYAVGTFSEEFRLALEADPNLAPQLISLLVERNFPESSQEELVYALPSGELAPERVFRNVQVAVRDRKFRQRVLSAYDEQCALCRWDLRVHEVSLGLEAAHIRWHSHEGPDVEANGLSLCLIHHRLFDRGLWAIDTQGRGMVAKNANLSGQAAAELQKIDGGLLDKPARVGFAPDPAFVTWHRENVFRG